MEKKILTEINEMRRIMGLELLVEGPKDDLYQLLKRFASKETTQVEKNEIESLLKKAGVTDNELNLLKQGQSAIITSLSGRLAGKLTGELSQEFEKIFLEKGIPVKALSSLSGGPRLVTAIEDLHTKFLNKEITSETYESTIKKIKDGLSTVLNRSELERAIKSIEANNLYRKTNPTLVDDVIGQNRNTIAPENVNLENNIPDVPPDTPITNADGEFVKQFGANELEKAKKWLGAQTTERVEELYRMFRNTYEKDNLTDLEKKRMQDFIDTRGQNRVQMWWSMSSKLTKAITLFAIFYGPNIVYMLMKMGIPDPVKFLLPWGPYFSKDEAEKEEIKQKNEAAKTILNFANYGMYIGDSTEKIGTLEEFLIWSGTPINNLENKTKETAKNWWEQHHKNYKDNLQWLNAMDEISKLIQVDLNNVPSVKEDNWKVKRLTEGEFQKDIVKRTVDEINELRQKIDAKYRETVEKIKNPSKSTGSGGTGSGGTGSGGTGSGGTGSGGTGSGGTGSGGTGSGGTGSGGTGSGSSGGGVPPWKK